MTRHPSGLDDTAQAANAWARYRTILRWMALGSLGVSLLVVALLWAWDGPLPWAFVALTIGGVWATMMMAAALMGLIFLSNGTGHDANVADPLAEEISPDD